MTENVHREKGGMVPVARHDHPRGRCDPKYGTDTPLLFVCHVIPPGMNKESEIQGAFNR